MKAIILFLIIFFSMAAVAGGIVTAVVLSNKPKYICNSSSGKCEQNKNGNFKSLKDCEKKCKKLPKNELYKCENGNCIKNDYGILSVEHCKAFCKKGISPIPVTPIPKTGGGCTADKDCESYGGRGKCDDKLNKCICDKGYYGPFCDYKDSSCSLDSWKATTNNCGGGWPTCQGIPGVSGGANLLTDPCLTFPDGNPNNFVNSDGTPAVITPGPNTKSIDTSSKSPCVDNQGNPISNWTKCYFGRGLIQLTWSCNYLKTQVSLYYLSQGLLGKTSPNSTFNSLLTNFQNMYQQGKLSICRNPNLLCGEYSTTKGIPTVTYNSSKIIQAMPWLACVIYWCENINISGDWNKCYSFSSALSGIGPAGSADAPKRIAFSTFFALVLGIDPNLLNFGNGGNLCLKKENNDPNGTDCTCTGSSGPSGNYYLPPNNIWWPPTIKCGDCDDYKVDTLSPGVQADMACYSGDSDPSAQNCNNGDPGCCSTCNNQNKKCPSSKPTPKSTSPDILFDLTPEEIYNFIINLPQNIDKNSIENALNYMRTNLSNEISQVEYKNTSAFDSWITQNEKTPEILMQYGLNTKLERSGGNTGSPLAKYAWDVNNTVNPMYSWQGLATAAYLWNKSASDPNSELHTYGGFCSESDITKRKLTLAIFLGNAMVESANFMVCQESITSADGTDCSSYGNNGNEFSSRYFNNCDNANPWTYSCQCGSGGGTGGGGTGGGGDGGNCICADPNCSETLKSQCVTVNNKQVCDENTGWLKGCKWVASE